MADYIGGDYIYSVLSNDATITSLVSTSLYNSRVVPDTDTSDKTINFYFTGNFDGSFEYGRLTWSVSCRAKTDYDALSIAMAVKDALNRVTKTVNSLDHYSTANILSVIPPLDDSDNYNHAVEILIKRQ